MTLKAFKELLVGCEDDDRVWINVYRKKHGKLKCELIVSGFVTVTWVSVPLREVPH